MIVSDKFRFSDKRVSKTKVSYEITHRLKLEFYYTYKKAKNVIRGIVSWKGMPEISFSVNKKITFKSDLESCASSADVWEQLS